MSWTKCRHQNQIIANIVIACIFWQMKLWRDFIIWRGARIYKMIQCWLQSRIQLKIFQTIFSKTSRCFDDIYSLELSVMYNRIFSYFFSSCLSLASGYYCYWYCNACRFIRRLFHHNFIKIYLINQNLEASILIEYFILLHTSHILRLCRKFCRAEKIYPNEHIRRLHPELSLPSNRKLITSPSFIKYARKEDKPLLYILQQTEDQMHYGETYLQSMSEEKQNLHLFEERRKVFFWFAAIHYKY